MSTTSPVRNAPAYYAWTTDPKIQNRLYPQRWTEGVYLFSNLTTAELRLPAYLATFADATTRKCWPGLARLAKGARMRKSWVSEILNKLERDGWLEIERGRGAGNTNHYTLCLPDAYEILDATDDAEAR